MDDGITEISTPDVTWRFDNQFMKSNWTCIWGKGRLGILDEPAPHLGQGCCSVGAELDGEDEAHLISAMAAMLEPEFFQFHDAAVNGGVFSNDERSATRVVEGACIFLNRPGFAGGEGCALHLAAIESDESPTDWKPSVCWQLPIKIDWVDRGDGGEVAHVRAWSRKDWGEEGDSMAWCCTEGELAYNGASPVVESLGDELTAMVGTDVYVELRRRLT